MGSIDVPQRLCVRIGAAETERRLNGTDGLPGNKVDMPNLQAMILRGANFADHLVRDDLLAAHKGTSDFGADVHDGYVTLV